MTDGRDGQQLLALLDEMRREDAGLDPPADLEARAAVRWLESAQAPDAGHFRAVRPGALATSWWTERRAWAAAIGVAAAVVVGIFVAPRRAVDDADVAGAPPVQTGSPAALSPGVETAGDFVAVAPDTFDVLSGTAGVVQIARVRVPRAVLADLGVVADGYRMGDPVQVDVVFGEDGLARAIRVVPASWRVR